MRLVTSSVARGQWLSQTYSPRRWDHEYRTDKWTYLGELRELSRYSVIVGYVRYFRRGGDVLDLGCGEGLLCRSLTSDDCATYVGVDVSRVAIERAQSQADDSRQFVCADIQTFEPARRFDVIVFNEVLYYVSDAVSLLRRYERHLNPDGVLVVSMFDNPQTAANWAELTHAYECLDETRTHNTPSGRRWTCRALQARDNRE